MKYFIPVCMAASLLLGACGGGGGGTSDYVAPMRAAAEYERLGGWGESQVSMIGTIGDIEFRANHLNGVVNVVVDGTAPGTNLADNPQLRAYGSARWDGSMLGFIPSEGNTPGVVSGNATITVNMATMNGRADFSGITVHPGNQYPGYAGTTNPWPGGDLGFQISVTGNQMQGSIGDATTVTGSFYGNAHNAVAGTLEAKGFSTPEGAPQDFTAAFGAGH